MPRNLRRVLLVLALSVVPLGLFAGAAQAYGPSYPYTTVLDGQFPFVALPGMAMITRTDYGYRYQAGQQSSHLTVTQVPGALRFADTGTQSWKSLDPACHRIAALKGVAAECTVPTSVSASSPMLVEIWPRLGDDYVDTTTLPAAFQVTVLADAGRDVIHLGAGNDFVNGAAGEDQVWGGGGSDWIRTGTENDFIQGGSGDDRVVGAEGNDVVRGGAGADSVEGSWGDDQLYAGPGLDKVLCGDGIDVATMELRDIARACETVHRY